MFEQISLEQLQDLVDSACDALGRTSATLRLASMETDNLKLARELWRRAYAVEALAAPIELREQVSL